MRDLDLTKLIPCLKASAIPARDEHQQGYYQRYHCLSGVPITLIVDQMLQVHTTPERQRQGYEAQYQARTI